MRKICANVVILTMLFAVFVPLLNPVAAYADDNVIIYVNPGIDVLKDVIESAEAGDTIMLNQGAYLGPWVGRWVDRLYDPDYPVYSDKILIDKPLVIQGNGIVTISDNPFKITSDNVIIKNLTFNHSLNENGGSIQVKNCSNVIVDNCVFSDSEILDNGGSVYIKIHIM